MGAAQVTPAAQAAVEKKVRQQAAVLEKADIGIGPPLAFRLLDWPPHFLVQLMVQPVSVIPNMLPFL